MASLRLRYQTLEFGKTDIHLCGLRNKQEFHDPEGLAKNIGISSATWPIFGVVWPSSIVLAHFVLDHNTDNKRILEVGCGLALSSLLLNKLGCNITATDYHPEVSKFLKRNARLNNDPDIPFERVDWSDSSDSLGLFDLIIGSDLLYEDEHIELLSSFISSHAKGKCEVILVDPGRGKKSKFVNQLELHGFTSTTEKIDNASHLPMEFKGFVLTFTR